MARARKKTGSSPPAQAAKASPSPEPETTGNSSSFSQTLLGKPGRPLQVNELLKRLKSLYEELQNAEEDEIPQATSQRIAKELVDPSILTNKDKGIKAWAGCCLTEVLHATAPNAPFTDIQLRAIFDMIITYVVPALGDVDDPYADQYIRVIQSLDEVKSIVLLSDIPSSDDLVTKLFLNSFDLLSDNGKKPGADILSKNTEYHLTRLLCTFVMESEILPPPAIEVILAQFLRIDPEIIQMQKSSAGNKQATTPELPRAYNLAKTICNTCAERMARGISQYFGNVIVDASDSAGALKSDKIAGRKRRRGGESSDEDTEAAHKPKDMKELQKAHKLLRELWRSAPMAIQSVIPQIEAELGAEDAEIRVLATETVGDLVSGIGAAGLARYEALEPAAYPSQSVVDVTTSESTPNLFTTPAAPRDFSKVYASAYSSFTSRKRDTSTQVRAAYASALGRVIMTSAGSLGLDNDTHEAVLQDFVDLLNDVDDKVRLAAIRAIEQCSYKIFLKTFAVSLGAEEESPIISALGERVKDKKPQVRLAVIDLLGKLWGVAAGAIAEGDENITALFGAIPTQILDAFYLNDPETSRAIIDCIFDSLMPLTFPPIKDKERTNGQSQRVKDSQDSQYPQPIKANPDAIRAQRLLILVKGLQQKPRGAFFALQKNQVRSAHGFAHFIKVLENYNGGQSSGKEYSREMDRYLDFMAQKSHDKLTARENLEKFAKWNDRRIYHLLKFAISPDNEYRKIVNAIKEIKKRLTEDSSKGSAILSTMLPAILESSVLIYNRSHVPTLVKYSNTDEDELGSVAHEILRQIADHHPDVFKSHVQTMCQSLLQGAPESSTLCEESTVLTLQSCAAFARKYPDDMPTDRNLAQAMVKYALHGLPPKAAKHAVSVIIASAKKKDMYMTDIAKKSIDGFQLGEPDCLSKLAALSQLMLLTASDLEDQQDAISIIAVQKVLLVTETAADSTEADNDVEWQATVGEDTEARIWAMKVLVNRLRGYADSLSDDAFDDQIRDLATPVYALLQKIIAQKGRILDGSAPPQYIKSRMRLLAGISLLKLSAANKHYDHMLGAMAFNRLALLIQDEVLEVRSAFLAVLKKYLSKGWLARRFYAMTFLLAFEPQTKTKEDTTKWMRARALAAKSNDSSLEMSLAYFISILTHHSDIEGHVEYEKFFDEIVDYVLFFLSCTATAKNISMIYHIAQRIKSVQDGIDPGSSERLYTISEIAQGVIRAYAEVQVWPIAATTAKAHLPNGFYAPLRHHIDAQTIADKQYANASLMDDLEERVRAKLKSKKRKKEFGADQAKKRVRSNSSKTVKASSKPKGSKASALMETSKAEASSGRRRSGRNSTAKNYAGMDDSDDDEDYEDDENDKVDAAGPDRGAEQVQNDGEDDDSDVGEASGSPTSMELEPNVEDTTETPSRNSSHFRGPTRANGSKTKNKVSNRQAGTETVARTRPTRQTRRGKADDDDKDSS